jgi:hypothetical protein
MPISQVQTAMAPYFIPAGFRELWLIIYMLSISTSGVMDSEDSKGVYMR